ncbi:RNA-guided endonuclease TnpB family protein [Streptomyces sp. WMMB 322]|uniref:RNA-guided endonuclease InsQ/TnpB family protein n=1 Tax=Streptomyces sp. WMMB 322 TaxID=1286821 RepID=UPI0009430310|nr:RNA-guided endonuclease TnpB family protein [Streptomyces sp. WMMB 322]
MGLVGHCRHARYVWNLCVEQQSWWAQWRGAAPGFAERCRQLTEARSVFGWLAAGSVTVQQQALRDFGQAMSNFFAGTHRRPTWRKAGRHESFRITAVKPSDVRRLSRRVGEVRVPKVGWVRFRWSRAVPGAKSYRVTRDRAGRWHIAFAVVPAPITTPDSGATVGIDRGISVSAALSTGQLLSCPVPSKFETARLARLQRRLAKATRGSKRRARLKAAIGRTKARQTDRRKDWTEKISTDLARRFDRMAFEDLRVTAMVASAKGTSEAPGWNVRQKAGLNRSILQHAWGGLLQRTKNKAPGRVILVPAAYTSQRCSACGHVAAENRESQSVFACRACGYAVNADVNSAKNIDTAAGHAVVQRGEGTRAAGPKNREPQLVSSVT